MTCDSSLSAPPRFGIIQEKSDRYADGHFSASFRVFLNSCKTLIDTKLINESNTCTTTTYYILTLQYMYTSLGCGKNTKHNMSYITFNGVFL